MNFLESLEPDARELLLSASRPVSFSAGATLVRHGEPARAAYIVREGSVEAIATLHGGESLTIATLTAGSIFGEMALIELGTCIATVRAATSVQGWSVAHEDFRALVSQAQPAALKLQHAITMMLADRLATLNARRLDCPAPEDRPVRALPPTRNPLESLRRGDSSFDAAAFLPRLPVFERCSPDEIDELVAGAAYLEAPAGQALFIAGEPARAAFVVVRGAVEIVAVREGVERRLAVLGPGQLVGHLSALRATPHTSYAFARESSLLLEFPRDTMQALYFGPSRASARLRHAVQVSLLTAFARTNRAVLRLLSHAKLAHGHAEDAGLEAALASQIATASPL